MLRGVQVAPGAASSPGSIVVHGIAFEGEHAREVSTLVRKVLILSKIFLMLTVLEAFEDIVVGNTSDTLGWLLVSLAMPVSAYCQELCTLQDGLHTVDCRPSSFEYTTSIVSIPGTLTDAVHGSTLGTMGQRTGTETCCACSTP